MSGSQRWQPVPESHHASEIYTRGTYIVKPTELKNGVNSMSSIERNI